MCIVEQPPAHIHIITMLPLNAAVPISPTLPAGEKQEIDFDVLSVAVLRMGIVL